MAAAATCNAQQDPRLCHEITDYDRYGYPQGTFEVTMAMLVSDAEKLREDICERRFDPTVEGIAVQAVHSKDIRILKTLLETPPAIQAEWCFPAFHGDLLKEAATIGNKAACEVLLESFRFDPAVLQSATEAAHAGGHAPTARFLSTRRSAHRCGGRPAPPARNAVASLRAAVRYGCPRSVHILALCESFPRSEIEAQIRVARYIKAKSVRSSPEHFRYATVLSVLQKYVQCKK